MKVVVRILVAVVVFGMIGVAEGKNNEGNTGLKGKIVSVMGNGKITIQTRTPGSNPNGTTPGGTTPPNSSGSTQTITIQTDASTTVEIDGQPGKVMDLQAGERVVISGDPTGIVTDIKATKAKGQRRLR